MNCALQGLGDIADLAKAIASGQLSPNYIDGQYWQPSYKTTPELLNKYLYVDDSTAARVASLLGGSIFKAAPTDLGPNAASAPLANWIRMPDGNVINAAMATPHWLWGDSGTPDECTIEDLLALNVPGSSVSAACIAKLQAAGMPVNGATSANNPYNPVNPEYIPPQAGPIAPRIGQPVMTDQGGNQQAVANQTYGSTVVPKDVLITPPAPIVPVNSSGTTQTGGAAPAGGSPAPTADWTSIFTESSIGGIPNWVLLAGVAVALFAFSKGGTR